jgi:hypothetical protein
MINMKLKQVRKLRTKLIAQDRVKITLVRLATVTDPITGDTIPNPAGTPSTPSIYCRIPHERKQVPESFSSPAGFSTNLQRMIMTDWKNIIQEGDTFSYLGEGFEIGPVDTITFMGETVGYQAVLKEAQ